MHLLLKTNNVQTEFFQRWITISRSSVTYPGATSTEVDFVLAETMLTADGRILDIGCGPGRHSIELTRRGYQVVGIDPSSSMIKAAKEIAARVGVEPQFWQSSGEAFFSAEKFDDENSIVSEIFTLVSPKETRKYLLRYHLFNPLEVQTLLENAGFKVDKTYSDFNHTSLTTTSPNMIAVARLSG